MESHQMFSGKVLFLGLWTGKIFGSFLLIWFRTRFSSKDTRVTIFLYRQVALGNKRHFKSGYYGMFCAVHSRKICLSTVRVQVAGSGAAFVLFFRSTLTTMSNNRQPLEDQIVFRPSWNNKPLKGVVHHKLVDLQECLYRQPRPIRLLHHQQPLSQSIGLHTTATED